MRTARCVQTAILPEASSSAMAWRGLSSSSYTVWRRVSGLPRIEKALPVM